jgi:predicted transcriptional regulator
LSIRPEFAEAILRGEKRYEFRRRIFSRTVDIVVVYVTAPVSRVVGEFDVRSIISAPLPALWSRTKSQAGIDEAYFLSYFEGKDEGYAIEIGDFRAYEIPYCPAGVLGKRPPQSFLYLDLETVVDAHEAQSGG